MFFSCYTIYFIFYVILNCCTKTENQLLKATTSCDANAELSKLVSFYRIIVVFFSFDL